VSARREDQPPQPAFRIVAHRFAELTGLELAPRIANLLEDRVTRRDTLFHSLADLAFEDAPRFEALSLEVAGWLARCPCETLQALAGYVAYCKQDFGRASGHFVSCVRLAPHNLDSYLDLAFALNHLGDELGLALLFDHALFVQACCANSAGPLTLGSLRRVAAELRAAGTSYAATWRTWRPDAPPAQRSGPLLASGPHTS
jgi:hypothetical protein